MKINFYGTTFANNKAAYGGGNNEPFQSYLDDSTISLMNTNIPNNLGGNPYKQLNISQNLMIFEFGLRNL